MQQNRRSFMKAGGLVAAMGLAGCSSGLLEDGGDETSGGDYWKYDPTTLASVANTFYGDFAFGQIYDNREFLPESTQSSFEMDGDVPIEADQVDRLSGVGAGQVSQQAQRGAGFGSAVLLGSWEKSALVEQIEDDGDATRTGTYEGFDIYKTPEATTDGVSPTMDTQAAVRMAVGDGAIVLGGRAAQQTSLDVSGEEAVTTMIDASNGNAPPLSNRSYVSTLESEISANSMRMGAEIDPTLVDLATEQAGTTQQTYIEGLRAGGFGASIEGDTTTFSAAVLYETASIAKNTGLAEIVNGLAPQLEGENSPIEDIEAKYSDNAVVATMSGPTREIFEEGMTTANTAAGTQLGLADPAGFVSQ